jgi:hypothetical protein
MEYRPQGQTAGRLLSAVALLGLISFGVLELRRGSRASNGIDAVHGRAPATKATPARTE